jgi:tetratricopeptide (TPR) repeat protein
MFGLTMSQDRLITSARTTLEPTPDGARMRKRSVALAGLTVLVFGFLFAVGLGALVVLLLLALVAGAGAFVLFGLARRYGDLGKRAVWPVRALGRTRQAGRHVFATGALLARQHGTEVRRRRDSTSRVPKHDARRQASRLNARGVELRRSDDFAEAIAAHTQALGLVRELGDREAEAMTLNNLALALGHAGDDDGARVHLEESATILRELGDEHHEGQVVANLGFHHARRGRREQALSCLEAALDKLDTKSQAYRHVEEQLRRAS